MTNYIEKSVSLKLSSYFKEIFKNYLIVNMLDIPDREFDAWFDLSTTVSEKDIYVPVIVLIGGVGGSGKSTFIKYCKKYIHDTIELSTIDPCRKLVETMVKQEQAAMPLDFSTVSEEVELKTDKYRTLLSELKRIWVEIDNGPNRICYFKTKSIVEEKSSRLIFINIREPDQIEKLKCRLLENIPCVVLTLRVNRIDPKTYTNESDKSTIDYDYDIIVNNVEDELFLEKTAWWFCDCIYRTTDDIVSLWDNR